jgi:hypothetical protein
MSRRPIYHLAGRRGSWTLWQEGETQPVFQARSKPEALLKARELAKRHLARLLVHSRGRLRQDLTFS